MRGPVLLRGLCGPVAVAGTFVGIADTGHVLAGEGDVEIARHEGAAAVVFEPQGRAPRILMLAAVEGRAPEDGTNLCGGQGSDRRTGIDETGGSGAAIAVLTGVPAASPPPAVQCPMRGGLPRAERCPPVPERLRTGTEAFAGGD